MQVVQKVVKSVNNVIVDIELGLLHQKKSVILAYEASE